MHNEFKEQYRNDLKALVVRQMQEKVKYRHKAVKVATTHEESQATADAKQYESNWHDWLRRRLGSQPYTQAGKGLGNTAGSEAASAKNVYLYHCVDLAVSLYARSHRHLLTSRVRHYMQTLYSTYCGLVRCLVIVM